MDKVDRDSLMAKLVALRSDVASVEATVIDLTGQDRTQIQRLRAENERLRAALQTAHDALRSYQYGNGSPDLAVEVADSVAKILKGGE